MRIQDSIQTHDSLEHLAGTCSAIGIGLGTSYYV